MHEKHRRRRRSHPRVRLRTPPGAVPGTLAVDAHAPRPAIRVLAYGKDDFLEQEIGDLEQVREFLGRWPVTWVSVEGLGDAAVIAGIGRLFNFHALALEDVANTLQRAKVNDYGQYLFFEGRIARLKQRLESEQISVFLGPDYVVSFEGYASGCLDPIRERVRKDQGRIRQSGADYLAYCMLDAVVDGYFPVLDEYAERLEGLDEGVVAGNPRDILTRLHEMRGDLLLFRRAIWPHREMINTLVRDPHPLVSDETRLHLRDCLDHLVTIVELTETYRELCSDLRDYALSAVSTRLNEIMKVLTVIATIFMPLTFIAGLYGMNFSPDHSPWNMPELRWYFGYPFALAVMAAVAGWMLLWFRRKGWLGPSLPPDETRTDNHPAKPTDQSGEPRGSGS